MRDWWLILALTLYLLLDVANPLMPGAITFGVDDSVELRQVERFRGHHDVVVPAQSTDRIGGTSDDVVVKVLGPMDPAAMASPPVRHARSSLFASSAPSDEDALTLRP